MSSPARLSLLVGTLLLLAGCLTPADKTGGGARADKPASRPRSLAFSPDGSVLVVGLATRTGDETTGGVRFLDAETLRTRSEHGLDYEVTDLTYSPDGKLLYLSGRRTHWRGNIPPTMCATIGWFDPAAGTSPGKPDADWEGTGASVCSADRRALAWVSSEKKAVLVRPLFPGGEGPQSLPLTCKKGSKGVLALATEHGPVAVVDADNRVQLIDPKREQPPTAIGSHRHPVKALLFTADGKRLISATENEPSLNSAVEVVVWDVATGRAVHRLPTLSGWFNRMFLSDDGRYLAVGVRAVNESTDLTVWELERGEKVAEYKYLAYGTAAAFSPDGRRLAVVEYSGAVKVLELHHK